MLKKLLSAMLVLLLLCGTLAAPASAADPRTNGAEFYSRAADPSTLDSWMQLFGPDVNSTANIGTVWTDKTVTTTTPADTEGQYDITMADEDTNFMVTLSTISATMSITGHETLPTDTVFVLDLSSSMYRFGAGNYYSTEVVSKMIDATNDAIHKLLTLNPLNRVGVVVYYGNVNLNPQSTASHKAAVLQLGNYAPLSDDYHPYLQITTAKAAYSIKQNNGTYKSYSEPNGLSGITVHDSLKAYSTAYDMPGDMKNDNIAGTYMQLGIQTAQQMFKNADTTIPADSDFQAGATRIPIIVVMSDGEPTAADDTFHNVGDAIMGNNAVGERSPAETDFLTQLTAALTREIMDRHYVETTPLFYTLGLVTSSISYDVMDPHTNDMTHAGGSSSGYTPRTGRAHKNYVKDTTNTLPEYQNTATQVNAKINDYWKALVTNKSVSINYLWSTGAYGGWGDNSNKSVTVNQKTISLDNQSFKFPTSVQQKYYVDKFFVAEDKDKFAEAFNAIVHEIELQSAYYPTYVENGAIGMSGYVDFHDEIGDMMEVRKVHGLVRRATQREIVNISNLSDEEKAKINIKDGVIYYKGEQIAKYFQENMYTSAASEEDKAAITTVLTTLFQKRLGLKEAQAQTLLNDIIQERAIYYVSDQNYSNAFSWYADANEDYLGLVTKENENSPLPSAKYKITSYWYASPYDLENTNSFIRIKREINSTKECVTWSVPASMIPLVRYEVALENESLENPGDIDVTYKNNFPMRAMFEVGLRSDINKYNAVEILTKAGYEHDEDGVFTFFSNAWDEDNKTPKPDPHPDQIHKAGFTVSTFQPSEQNERYFITSDLPLYTENGASWTPGSGAAYVKRPYFSTTNDWSGGKPTSAELKWTTEKVAEGFEPIGKNGVYYVDIRTPRYPEARSIPKVPNTTMSFGDSTYEPAHATGMTHVISILGNNGTFRFTADTGLAITKEIDTETPDSSAVFTFVIEPAEGNENALNGEYAINYHKDGTLIDGQPTTVTAADGKITVTLHHGETAYIAGNAVSTPGGLPAGSYTVTEQIVGEDGKFFYEVNSITVTNPGEASVTTKDVSSATVTVNPNQVTQVDYTNVPVATGAVEISKTVTAADGVTPPADAEFTFEVQLDTAHHGGKTIRQQLNDGAETSLNVPDDGKFTVTLKGGDTMRLSGLAADENVLITVTETSLPDGFTVQGSQELTKEIISNGTVEFAFTNDYQVQPTSIAFSGTKTLEGRNLANGEFSFELYETGADYSTAGKTAIQTVTHNAQGAFAFEAIRYSIPGTHYYVVKETGSAANVTNDQTVYNIQVAVTDNSAKLSAVVTGAAADALNFTNTYTPDDITVPLSGAKTLTGRALKATDVFTFNLYETDSTFAVADGAAALQSTQNTGAAFAFEDLSFDEAGTYYYVVKEAASTVPGVTHDSTVYHVTITVSYDQQTGAFSAATAITKPDGSTADAPAFVNAYVPAPVKASLSGTKSLSVPKGLERTLQDQEFTFELYAAVLEGDQYTATGSAIRTATNDAQGAFTFADLSFDTAGIYHYIVKEAAGVLPGVTYDTAEYPVTITVTDDLNGQLVASVSGIPEGGIAFTNTYKPTETSFTFSGKKTLQGRTPLPNEFSFSLYAATLAEDGSFVIREKLQTVNNSADGSFAFEALANIDAVGVYHYIVKEDAGTLPGVTYDTTEYHITVTVTDEGAALTPSATVVAFNPAGNAPALLAMQPDAVPLTQGDLDFTNVYTPADTSVVLSGTKVLTGRESRTGEFSFELCAASLNQDGVFTAGEVLQTVTNTAAEGSNTFTFAEIPLTSAGDHYFLIREKDTNLANMAYDSNVYQVKVTVTDNLNGQLVADAPVYTLVTADGTASAAAGVTFTNRYDASNAFLAISGLKELDVPDGLTRKLQPGEFSFALYEASETFAITGDPLQTVVNDAEGKFAFTQLEHTEKGVYRYVVKEVPGALPGVTYDTAEYRITVTVTDNDQTGQLVPVAVCERYPAPAAFAADPAESIKISVTDLAFLNTYTAKPTSVAFSGTKVLTGRNLYEDEFRFSLYEADSSFAVAEGAAALQTVTNAADGSFAFTALKMEKEGVYHFVVLEEAGSNPATAYDPTMYLITVTVSDKDAQLQADVSVTIEDAAAGSAYTPDALNFHNVHDETDAEITFTGKKTYQGHSLAQGNFTFTLYTADESFLLIGDPIQTVTNAADGSFAFSKLVYDKTGVYRYIVREDHGGQSYIAYDEAEYRITVNVRNNDGVLIADVTAVRVQGDESTPVEDLLTNGFVFENRYVPAGTTAAFRGQKLLYGAELTENMFSFQLYAADHLFQPIGQALETVANQADGSFAFSPRVFRSTGTYHFVIVEDASAPLPHVTYDPTVYRVAVTVTDNSHGQLLASVSMTTADGLAVDTPVFENFYLNTPDTSDHSSLEMMLALCLTSLTALAALLLLNRRRARI